jgi:hypothetical protein
MADLKKSGLAFAKAFKQASSEADAALAAQKAERMAQLVESERALPLRLPRATPKTKQELTSHAERVGRQMLGEHITSGKKGDTKNLAGRSMKENQRIKELEYELAPTKDIPASSEYESRIGDINVAFPGDYTVSDVELKSLRGQPVGSRQQGGSRYGLGKMDQDEPLFWASSEMPAQLAQDKITDVAHLFEPDRVMAEHLAMGPVATNFAQHFADANLRAIDYSKLSKKDMNTFDKIIAGGYDKKNPKTGVIETVAFPNWPGIADPEAAYAAMKADPELRKWFNSRMKTPKVTEATNMPNGLDVQWAITSPDLRNMEVNLTGHSVGEMVPNAKLTDTAEHDTYAKGIRGKYKGHQGVLTPFQISYPDAAQHISSTQRPQDFTGTIQKVFPHQVVDQQYIDEYGEYKRQLQKILTGKKKGGSVTNREDYQARLDSMLEKHMAGGGGAFKQIQFKADGGGAFKKMQFKAQGGTVDNTMPDTSDAGEIKFAPKYASGGAIHHGIKPLQWKAGGGGVGKAMKAVEKATAAADAALAAPKVDRLSMNYKDVTKRVPEVAEAVDKLFKGEITKAQYNDIVNMYKPVTPYSFVPKPATKDEAVDALRGDAAKSRYGAQAEYTPGSKVGLRLDIPAYTGKGVWVNSIHDEKAKKVAYGPVASVKNADLGISQNESKRIALGGAKAPYAKIKGDWNPMSEEEAVAKAQEYLNHPEWRQIGMDPERHSYFYDRATMTPITGAEEIIQIGPLVLGKNPKYGKADDFEYADGGKIAKGVMGALAKASKMAEGRVFKTTDGYTFKEMPDGRVTDGDMTWGSAKEFLREMPHAFQQGDELGKRRAGMESYGSPSGEQFMDKWSEFMSKPSEDQLIQRAINKQNAPKPKLTVVKRKGGLARFDGGGIAVDQSNNGGADFTREKKIASILAQMAKEQGAEEVASLKKPRSFTDLANRGFVAPLAGLPVDMINMGLEGVDAVRNLANGKPVANRLASDKPYLGSEHLKDLMREYGMTTDEERPMMETVMSIFSPSASGAAKGATKAGEAVRKGARAAKSGLNSTAAMMRRPQPN